MVVRLCCLYFADAVCACMCADCNLNIAGLLLVLPALLYGGSHSTGVEVQVPGVQQQPCSPVEGTSCTCVHVVAATFHRDLRGSGRPDSIKAFQRRPDGVWTA
jgi:hypothetical protein